MNTVALVPKRKTGKVQWWGCPAISQPFPFPETLIYYISMNPASSKAYNKLIQCCKYFFEANQILVAGHLHDSDDCKICQKDEHTDMRAVDECCFKTDIQKILCNIWLTKHLFIYGNGCPCSGKSLLQKIYRCEIDELCLFRVTIPYDNFKILSASLGTLLLFPDVKIIYNDGKTVLLDKILEICPKIEYFGFAFSGSMLAASTLKDISKLQNLRNLHYLKMNILSEIFDIQEIFEFLTKEFMDTDIHLHFNNDVSAEYKSQLDALDKKLIELNIQNHFVKYHDAPDNLDDDE